MTGSKLILCILLPLVLASAASRAAETQEASAEVLLDTLRNNKKALVEVNLALSDDEARAFWPIYDRYQEQLGAVQERLLRIIEDYEANFTSMSDAKAMTLVEEYLAVEQDRAAVRRSFLEPISEVLPGRKVMRFYQIENKIEAVLRYRLAASIPVVEQ